MAKINKRFLIINPSADRLYYIPMGTFGLCDYLRQQGIECKIFHMGLYPDEEAFDKLLNFVKDWEPDYFGVIAHWKELFQNSLFISFFLKQQFPTIPIILGGLTASYFCKELLSEFEVIDYVIRGDPELSMELLIKGENPTDVPNLAYRDDGEVMMTGISSAKGDFIDKISFCDLSFLQDHKIYIEKINGVLGFSVFIARGCPFNCTYCGGSKSAFLAVTNRKHLAFRSVESVIKDLEKLKEYTDRLYFCQDQSVKFLAELWEKIADSPTLAKHFSCSYGCWSLPKPRVLDAYEKAFKLDKDSPEIFEISPETMIEEDRPKIRDPRLCYSNEELETSLLNLSERFGSSVKTHLFISTLHPTHTPQKLDLELEAIHQLRERFYIAGFGANLLVHSGDLSTDPGSSNWEQANWTKDRGMKELFASIQKKILATTPEGQLNLMIYRPDRVSEDCYKTHLRSVILIDRLEFELDSLYYSLVRVLGFPLFLKVVKQVLEMIPDQLVDNIQFDVLIGFLTDQVKINSFDIEEQSPGFLVDFTETVIKISKSRNLPWVFGMNPVNGTSMSLWGNPTVNWDNILVLSYDLLNCAFLESVKPGFKVLKKSPALYMLGNKTCSGPHPLELVEVLKNMNGLESWDEILDFKSKPSLVSKDEWDLFTNALFEFSFFVTKPNCDEI